MLFKAQDFNIRLNLHWKRCTNYICIFIKNWTNRMNKRNYNMNLLYIYLYILYIYDLYVNICWIPVFLITFSHSYLQRFSIFHFRRISFYLLQAISYQSVFRIYSSHIICYLRYAFISNFDLAIHSSQMSS